MPGSAELVAVVVGNKSPARHDPRLHPHLEPPPEGLHRGLHLQIIPVSLLNPYRFRYLREVLREVLKVGHDRGDPLYWRLHEPLFAEGEGVHGGIIQRFVD